MEYKELVVKTAKEIEEKLLNEAASNWENFCDEDGIVSSEETLFEKIVEKMDFESFGVEVEKFLDDVYLAINTNTWEIAKETIQEAYMDAESFRKNPLGYYGLRQKDFY